METSEAVNNSFHNFMFYCREQGKTNWIFPGDLKDLICFKALVNWYFIDHWNCITRVIQVYTRNSRLSLGLYILTYMSSTESLNTHLQMKKFMDYTVRSLSQTLLRFMQQRTQVCLCFSLALPQNKHKPE